jgi:hypothetical protein
MRFRALFAVAVAAILVLALMPASGGADWFDNADKLRHAGAFAVLWWLGWRARMVAEPRLALGLLAFGVFIEIAQSFTPDRDPSLADVLADAVGIAIGWWVTRRGWL